MVLQQGAALTLSGRTLPGVKVEAGLGETVAGAVSDESGAFSITLPAQSNSTAPQTLTVRDPSGATTYTNILIRNVFLRGGQSNMELPVVRALDVDNQLQTSADDGIRLLMVPKATAPVPQSAFAAPVAWRAAACDSVAEFSAACFYMSKALRRKDPATPVGLIHANWGGRAAREGPGTCRFVLAHADGNCLALAVPEGMSPTRVRYAWADSPVVNLVDGEGMPAPGFELRIGG